MSQCDFCSDPVRPNDANARIYDAEDFSTHELNIGFKGAWLACSVCAAFIRQHDDGTDPRAKTNLAMRALEKNRRKYGLRGAGIDDINKILLEEIKKLHDAFWQHRTDMPPVPYAIKKIEG